MSETLNSDSIQAIDAWIKKYPEGKQQSAVIPALHIAQAQNGGYLTPALIEAVACYLQMPTIAVQEVATFYSMFNMEKVGKYQLKVCGSVSCLLCGYKNIIQHIKDSLGIDVGQTTKDGRFTLQKVECLGACVDAPVMQLGRKYYEKLTPEKIDELIKELP